MCKDINYTDSFIIKKENKYRVSWKATNSVLANDLLLREILKAVPYVKGRLLDIGCGEKPYLDVFSSHIASYTGIDIPYSLDILRNCNLGNTLKDTFNLNSSRCQPEVNEGSNISKSLIVIHDFMTVNLRQNLVLFHTT